MSERTFKLVFYYPDGNFEERLFSGVDRRLSSAEMVYRLFSMARPDLNEKLHAFGVVVKDSESGLECYMDMSKDGSIQSYGKEGSRDCPVLLAFRLEFDQLVKRDSVIH